MSNDPSFSIYDFRKWLTDQSPNIKMEKQSQPLNQNNNLEVECRLGLTRLEMQIAKHNPNVDHTVLAKEFKESGAKVKQDDGINLILETTSGQFSLPKLYTKNR